MAKEWRLERGGVNTEDWYIITPLGVADATIVETVGGDFLVTAGGIQWGPPGSPRDAAGAASDTWPTPAEALRAWVQEFDYLYRGVER